jgi:hypothetical protein
VEDPVKLRTLLTANATDAQDRVAAIEGVVGTDGNIEVADGKVLRAVETGGAATNSVIAAGKVAAGHLSGNVAIARIEEALKAPTAIGGTTPAAGTFAALAGQSGVTSGKAGTTAGFLDMLTAGTTQGKLRLLAVNTGGDYTMTLQNAAIGASRTYTIPDAGTAAADFVLTAKATAQVIASPVTVEGAVVAGKAGTAAGSVELLAPTAANGSLKFVAVNTGAERTVTVQNAAHGQSSTYTIPDAGAAASFVMTEGAQTVNGVKTFGSAPVMSGASISGGTVPVAAVAGTAIVNADFNLLRSYLADGLLISGDLKDYDSGSTNKFSVGANTAYTLAGVTYVKTAANDIGFSYNDTITFAAAPVFGGWLIQINSSGTISTLAATGQSGVVDQAHADAATALASAKAITNTASNVTLGYLVVEAAAASWTANTDTLSGASTWENSQIKSLPAAK